MNERLRNDYFIVLKMILFIVVEMYIVLSQSVLTGASAKVLLLLALFIGVVAGKELAGDKFKFIFLVISGLLLAFIIKFLGDEFYLLGVLLGYEVLTYFKAKPVWYFLPIMFACVPGNIGYGTTFIIAVFIGMIYYQHDFVVEAYRKQSQEDIIAEQELKRNMNRKEFELQQEVRKSLLMAENQILEERSQLSQTLHDKLGHNINGSVYQLEAVKVLMDKEPEASKKMVQAVIDQLRTGMDEIRAILRKERPKKYKLAIMQLQKLCEDCKSKGVDAELVTSGELKDVPEKYLEIILDNAYEAVSNSMKYAKCNKIKINVHVLNQMIRCSISDNGTGCIEVVDGMGISGMRKRVREVNGILDFETEAGFTINMLLPL